jgi:hypothetical protein
MRIGVTAVRVGFDFAVAVTTKGRAGCQASSSMAGVTKIID